MEDSNSSCIESASSQGISFFMYIDKAVQSINNGSPWIPLASAEYSIQKPQFTGICLWQIEEHCQKEG